MRNCLRYFASTLVVYLFFTDSAFAYLDPGTGSMLLQGLIGAAVGGWVVTKLYWGKLKNLVSPRGDRAHSVSVAPTPSDATTNTAQNNDHD